MRCGLPGHDTIIRVSTDLKQLGERLRERGIPLTAEQFIQVVAGALDGLREASFDRESEADWVFGDPTRRQ